MSSYYETLENSDFIYLVYPSLIVVVAAEYNGKTSAMPAAWNTPLSISPPLIGVSISPERYTYRLILESKAFTINLLPYSELEKVSMLGDVSGRFLKGKIEKIGLKTISTKEIKSIGISEAVAIIECRLEKVVPVGDHDLIVGRVVRVGVKREYLKPKKNIWSLEKYKPILYLGRTRRPERVVRIYTTVESKTSEVEYALGDLKDKALKRRSLIRAINEEYLKLKGTIAEKYGIDSEDVDYVLESIKRGRA